MPPSVLPKHAQDIFTAAEESAKNSTCKNSSDVAACAAKVAWSAVKRKYAKGKDGAWHEKSDDFMEKEMPNLVEFSLAITKASYDKATGDMRWTAVASDTGLDAFEERMSVELFDDFIRRADLKVSPPDEWCSDGWCGGMPYVSLSHYPDLDGEAICGDVSKLYVDGNRLKASGVFRNSPLGTACFRSVCDGLYKNLSEENKIRISIGFLDYKHSHDGVVFDRKSLTDKCPLCAEGLKGKQYLGGLLIHLALTRVPANNRTDIDVEVDKSMTTRKSDAASIVGEELANEIEEKAKLVNKSEALIERTEEEVVIPEAEVTKGMDEEDEEETPFGGATSMEDADAWMEAQKEKMVIADSWMMLQNVMGNIMTSEACTDKKKYIKKAVDGFKSRIEMKALVTLADFGRPVTVETAVTEVSPFLDIISPIKSAFDGIISSDGTVEEKLTNLQTPFEEFANVIRMKVAESVKPVEAPKEQTPVMPDVQRMVSDAIAPLAESIKALNSQIAAMNGVNSIPTATPVRRSIQPNTSGVNEMSTGGNDLRSIVRRSVGLSN